MSLLKWHFEHVWTDGWQRKRPLRQFNTNISPISCRLICSDWSQEVTMYTVAELLFTVLH